MKPVYATYAWQTNRGIDWIKYCPQCGTLLSKQEVAYKPRPVCKSCGFVYYRNPYPAVSVLVIKDKRILLGKRAGEPGKGRWAMPSGYIEFEDDFITTAVHEVQEETGLVVEPQSILSVQSAFLPPDYHFLGIYLLAFVTGGELNAGDDLEAVEWFLLTQELPPMAFQSDVEIIQDFLTGKNPGLRIER